MRFLGLMLGALAVAVLWMSLVAPSVARIFGVRLAFGLWRSYPKNQNLTRPQFVIGYGVFSWGVGMFLCFFTWDYLLWRFADDLWSGRHIQLEHAGRSLLIWLAIGLLYGLLVAPRKRGEHA